MLEHVGWALVVVVLFSVAAQAEAGDVNLVRRYHRASTIGPRGYGEPEPGVNAPAGFKSYPRAPRFDFAPDLPRLDQLTPEALKALHSAFCHMTTPLARARENLDGKAPSLPTAGKAVLGRVLFGGMGITKVERFARGTFSYRSAPSAGALYPVEVYVAAGNVEGLPRGLYHYDVAHNQLEQVGPADAAIEVEAALRPAERGQRAAAYLVLTGVFARSRAKYNVRAYRYVLLDAGHVAGNLTLTAAANGLGARLLPHFDDSAVNQVLGLDGEEEASLLVVALATAEAGESPALTGEEVAPKRARRAGSGTPASALSLQVHQATCLGPEELAALGEPELPPETPAEGAKLVVLPLPAEPRRSLEEALVSRRSERSFSRRPLSTGELSALLAWPGSASPPPGLRWYVVVSEVYDLSGLRPAQPALSSSKGGAVGPSDSVEGVSPGVYRYWPRERTLELKAPAVDPGALAEAVLGQDWVAAAPCVVVAVAEGSTLDGPCGARWYRDVHLATGEAGEWLYLAAEGLNLGTCAVGAFADEALARVLGLEGGSMGPAKRGGASPERSETSLWPLILYPVGPR